MTQSAIDIAHQQADRRIIHGDLHPFYSRFGVRQAWVHNPAKNYKGNPQAGL